MWKSMKFISSAIIVVAVLVSPLLVDGCAGAQEYTLTISVSGPGTASPVTSTHQPGTEVTIAAKASKGCEFVNWTGDVDTVADVNARITTITMDGDYSITANFAE